MNNDVKIPTWHYNPDNLDLHGTNGKPKPKTKLQSWGAHNCTIVVDLLEMVGKTKVTAGNLSLEDIPSFIRNRFSPEIQMFILGLMKARQKKLEKEKTIDVGTN